MKIGAIVDKYKNRYKLKIETTRSKYGDKEIIDTYGSLVYMGGVADYDENNFYDTFYRGKPAPGSFFNQDSYLPSNSILRRSNTHTEPMFLHYLLVKGYLEEDEIEAFRRRIFDSLKWQFLEKNEKDEKTAKIIVTIFVIAFVIGSIIAIIVKNY